ncbi:MAG: hypothetical protein M0R38_08020 [Bacteroidia bacterium]|nr:hypothetical protein [Bacteroidia bacterium]
MELYFHSLTNLAEARFAAAAHPKFLGFCFSPHSPNAIHPIEFVQIRVWLSGGVIVGQFLYESESEINKLLDSLRIEWIEIPADHPDIETLSQHYKLITFKGMHPLAQFSRAKDIQSIDHCVANTFYALENYVNIADTIQQKKPYGIALSGKKIDTEVGMTDLSHWMDIMEELDFH